MDQIADAAWAKGHRSVFLIAPAVIRQPATGDFEPVDLATITCPVLVVVGELDFAHPGDKLASLFPAGRCETLKNVDHFATPEAFGFFDATLEFLDAF